MSTHCIYICYRKKERKKERTGLSYQINIHVHVAATPLNIVIMHVASISYLKVWGGEGEKEGNHL